MLNLHQIIGHIGQPPELRYLPDGKAVVNFSIATTDRWKDKNSGEHMEATEWHRCTAFERLAEIIGEYTRKGSKIYVAGKSRTRKYVDKENIERSSVEITVSQIELLDPKQQDGQQQERQQRPARQAAPGTAAPAQRQAPACTSSGFDDMADDIPF